MGTRIFPNLYVQSGEEYAIVPYWANFFISLGHQISGFESPQSNFVLAISVPSLAYAATLISFGYLVARSHQTNQDYSQNVEFLKQLPIGTPVYLRSLGNKKYSGVLLGCRSVNGENYFVVQTDKNNTTQRHIKFKDSGNIQVRESGKTSLPSTQKGRQMSKANPFLDSIIGSERASNFVSFSKLEVMIIGQKSKLRKEVTSQKFASRNKKTGILQDILRVKQFQVKSNAYRSFILSSTAKPQRVQGVIGSPPLVIFDGSSGYLKWNHYWNNSNKVVILSRTDTQFQPAIEQLVGQYITRNLNNNYPKISIVEMPAGIEAMIFEEK